MIKPDDPRDLCVNLIQRSPCAVKVACVIEDAGGRIMAWGWNGAGTDGLGLCAERHAIGRANRSRLHYGYIYVAGIYSRGTLVNAKPCAACQRTIGKYHMDVVYRAKNGAWKTIHESGLA